MAEHGEKWFTANVRIEHLFWLPGTVPDYHYPTEFRNEFVEDLPDEPDAPIYEQLPELAKFAEGDDYPDADYVAELLTNRSGFIAQLATPVFGPERDGMSTFSWGHYRTHWCYAETIDALTDYAVAWAEATQARDRSRNAA